MLPQAAAPTAGTATQSRAGHDGADTHVGAAYATDRAVGYRPSTVGRVRPGHADGAHTGSRVAAPRRFSRQRRRSARRSACSASSADPGSWMPTSSPYSTSGSSAMRSNASLHTGWRCSTMNDTSRARTSSAARLPAAPAAGVAEARVEEAGVVGAQLAGGGIVGEHLGGVGRRDAHALGREQQVEDLGLEHDPPAPLGVHRFPVVLPARASRPASGRSAGCSSWRGSRRCASAEPDTSRLRNRPVGERELGCAERMRVAGTAVGLSRWTGDQLRIAEAGLPQINRTWLSARPVLTRIANVRGTTSR